MKSESYDYIVIGTGSAGSVVAGRLSQHASVLVLEAGPTDASPTIRMPAAVSINIKGARYNWKYLTEPQSRLADRKLSQPRGRVVGGSSAINGMIYIRGHALDYDRWQDEGAAGWSYRDVLPYFKAVETFQGRPSLYRGTAGRVPVTPGSASNPLHTAFLEAGQQAGHPFTEDVNGYQQAGVSFFDKNIMDGERWSTARAYLRDAGENGNLSLLTDARALRILFDHNTATGVEYIRSGRTYTAFATSEIVVCAGAIESPKILMMSGIGDADELRKLGIRPVVDLPPVGQNLQDHMEVHIQYRCRKPITLYRDLKLHRQALIGLEWMLFRTGKGATNHYETGAFLSSDTTQAHPNIQLHFVPIVYNNAVDRKTDCHGYRVHAGPVRSQSRGYIRLRSADPLTPPIIQPNSYAHDADWAEMRAAIRLSREIFAQRAFTPFRDCEMSPGTESQSDDSLNRFIRETSDTGYHPAGTCRMGAASDSVVNPAAMVYGVNRLRVVDASIMPSIVSGNLNAPVMMMAEKVSDMIIGKQPLPAMDVAVFEERSSRSGPLENMPRI